MAPAAVFKAYTATPVAPVAVIPTTAAHFAIYNTQPIGGGGKSLYIQTLEAVTVVSAGAAQIIQLHAHQSAGLIKAMPSATKASGPAWISGGFYPSVAQVGSAVTIVQDSVWHPCSESDTMGAGTTTIANGTWSNVNGLYVIQPGGLLSLAVLCSAAGSATCNIGVTWFEA